jgi:diguanylate cyclase
MFGASGLDKERRRVFATVGEMLFKAGLEPTPANYAEFYALVTGVKAEAPSVTAPLPEASGAAVFPQELIEAARRQVETLADVAATTRDHVRDYQGDLRSGAEQLSSGAEGDSVAELVRITATMIERSRFAEAQLERASEEARRLREQLDTARNEARTDALTGISNRRAFEDRYSALSEAGVMLSVALCDIDHFKRINDTHGHEVGDRVLKLVAQVLQARCGGAMVARYGGEEFAVLFASATAATASRLVDAARIAVSQSIFKERDTGAPIGQITFSAGVATAKPGESAHECMLRVDRLLYKAKDGGRNCIGLDAFPRPMRTHVRRTGPSRL